MNRQLFAAVAPVLTAGLVSMMAPAAAAEPTAVTMPSPSGSAAAAPAANRTTGVQTTFHPPAESAMPDSPFGKMVRLGEQIFENPARYARPYVGNELRCSSCHLDAGRLAGSAPMWAAYLAYPAYRSKNHKVSTFEERLQGCFRYSMNGRPPPLGSTPLVALESYAYWLAQGAPLNPQIAGRGYPAIAKPPQSPDYRRGQQVYAQNCALCHGSHGQGQRDTAGNPAFPALWGPGSFNWGAGMASLKNAAPFIKANMPLSLGGSLSVQQAWDVALFVDSHERPQDPRFNGSVSQTRQRFHHSANSMYGKTVNGHVLGQGSVPSGRPLPPLRKAAAP